MKSKFLGTVKDTFVSSLPLAVIIVVCLLVSPLEAVGDYLKIAAGYVCVVFGQAMFLVGLETSILPIGRMVGGSFAKYNKLAFVLSFGFVFGLLATVAEPALSVLAKQISSIMPLVNSTLFIWITGTGIGIGVAIALVRIVKNINIKLIFGILYSLVFITVIFSPGEFIAIAFDGSGATTGDVSVPFILALGLGISATFSKSKTNDDSLGIIGISSVGPIIAVLIYGIIVKIANGGALPPEQPYDMTTEKTLGDIVLGNLGDVALAVLPIILISIPFLLFILKLPKRTFLKLIFGVIPVYVGLLIFLSGIDFGFGFVGQYIGQIFFDKSRPEYFKWLLLIVGFILGAAITVSEPAVTVLGVQIEELTNGHIKRSTISVTLAIGIGFYEGAITCGVVIVFIMSGLQKFDVWTRKHSKYIDLYIDYNSEKGSLGEFLEYARENQFEVSNIQMSQNEFYHKEKGKQRMLSVTMTVVSHTKRTHAEVIDVLSKAKGIQYIEEL